MIEPPVILYPWFITGRARLHTYDLFYSKFWLIIAFADHEIMHFAPRALDSTFDRAVVVLLSHC